MYKNIYYDDKTNNIHLWDDKEGYSKYPYKKYAYILDDSGDFKTIDGKKCKKISSWSEDALKFGLVFEHDVNACVRTLIDLYSESDETSEDLNTLFLDIEVLKGEKYSTTTEANNIINAISYYDTNSKEFTCLLIDTQRENKKYNNILEIGEPLENQRKIGYTLITFNDEKSLLTYFINIYKKIKPDILSGWNISGFDMPYLYNRLINLFGHKVANSLSPIDIIKQRNFNEYNYTISIAGVSILDYLNLYKKFTPSEKSNYKLDTIAKEELGRGKVEYEGNLDDLYNNDIEKFASYNIIDVELLISLDEKLDYINIAVGVCHEGHVPYESIEHSSMYIDGAILTFCRRLGLVVSSNKFGTKDTARGAYVKPPVIGLHKWIYTLDVQSLYPSLLMSLNISPETKFARVLNWNTDDYLNANDIEYDIEIVKDLSLIGEFNNLINPEPNIPQEKQFRLSKKQLTKYLKDNNLCISSAGIIYDQNKKGVIPLVIEEWFAKRKEFKSLMKTNDKNVRSYYDRKQYIKKIQLNTVYGVLLLKSFRFYDTENGESVTLSGQSLIKFADRTITNYYNKNRNDGLTSSSVVYSDTDSVGVSAIPLMKTDTVEEVVDIVNVVQPLVDSMVDKYMKHGFNSINNRIRFMYEKISRRAFFMGKMEKGKFIPIKKRYALQVVDDEGEHVNKVVVKGMESVRSDFPKVFRDFIKSCLNDILNDKDKNFMNSKIQDFKKTINNINIMDLMYPTGAKDITSKDTNEIGNYTKGTAVHVKAALNYNNFLKLNKIKDVPPINDGDKVLWAYLRSNPYNMEAIAIPVDNPHKKVIEFVNNTIDRNKIFETALLNKLDNYWLSLNFGKPELNTNISKFFT